MNFCFARFLLLAVALTGTISLAVTPIIGVASVFGTFIVNDRVVEGNANLFDGSEVKTTKVSSEIYLKNGPIITLGVNSAALLYQDRFALEQGASKVDHLYRYRVQLGPWNLQGETPETRALVRRKGDLVEVAALNSSMRVLNERGALVNRLAAGSSLQLNIAGQSVMVPDQSGASPLTPNKAGTAKQLSDYLSLGASVGGAGIATGAVLQKHPTSP